MKEKSLRCILYIYIYTQEIKMALLIVTPAPFLFTISVSGDGASDWHASLFFLNQNWLTCNLILRRQLVRIIQYVAQIPTTERMYLFFCAQFVYILTSMYGKCVYFVGCAILLLYVIQCTYIHTYGLIGFNKFAKILY